MRKLWLVVGVAALVAALGVAAVGTVALAQDDDGPFNFRARFKEVLAGLLDVTVEEYDAAVEQAQAQVVDEAEAEGWLTEDQADRMRERAEEGHGPRGFGKDFMGPRGERGFMAPRGGKGFMGKERFAPLKIAADLMEMDVQDLAAELRDGKSITAVAEEHGVTSQEIVDAYVAQLEERLMQPVENGRITEKMAEAMVEQARETLPELLEKTWEDFGPGGFRHGGQPGRMWGFPGQSDL
jgi:hypothetical protein